MKLKFYSPEHLDKNLKATIHNTGKLGFTVEAAKKMGLSEGKSMSIARNEENLNDDNLYVIVNDTQEKDAFNVNKAGKYFYVNTKALFEKFEWDYVRNAISFDIKVSEYQGNTLYIFNTKHKVRNDDADEDN